VESKGSPQRQLVPLDPSVGVRHERARRVHLVAARRRDRVPATTAPAALADCPGVGYTCRP